MNIFFLFLDKSFITLTRMEEVTSEKRFKCHICSKTFNRKEHLINHERILNRIKMALGATWSVIPLNMTSPQLGWGQSG